MNYAQARFNMMEQQIRPWNVLDPKVLSLLESVAREQFVPTSHQALAYADIELPIGDAQVMLAPKIQAKLVQDVQIKPTDSILQIGAGTGYMAALLAKLGRHVTAIEVSERLANIARDNLKTAGIDNANANVMQMDASQELSSLGTFDVVVVCGSLPSLPTALLDRLNLGGRLIAIVGDAPIMQATICTKISETGWQKTTPWDTVAPRLSGFAQASRFQF